MAARADWPVLAFALAIAVMNGLIFGIVPALRAASASTVQRQPGEWIAGPAAKDRTRGGLVIVEIAITVALVIVAGQLLKTFIELVRTDPGFDTDHIIASVVLPPASRYPTPAQRASVYRKFLEAVRRIPGVQSAGTVDALPFSGENHGGLIATSAAQPMQPSAQVPAEIDVVSSEYLQTMGVHLVQGRWFREYEMNGPNRAAIISDATAARLWPRASAIGKQICVYCTPENTHNWKQVVGVVSSIRHRTLDDPLLANVYLSAGAFEKAAFVVVKTQRRTAGLERSIRVAIASVDPDQPVFLSAPMGDLLADSIADRRFMMTLLASTAFLALVMSAAGVYGVVSYVTSRRTRELGVRMALGATRGNVQLLVFRHGFTPVALGLAAGTLLTLMLLRVLRGIVVGFEPQPFWQVMASIAVVSLTAAIACWVPANCAAKGNPMEALRYE
ncbi:MAG: ABC transporter permease [Acidobacteria bacterium]|nr:ABC transporter permease [Acidobacteriota bacterium]